MTNFKWYRKWCGGIWNEITFTYKKDMGMTRVTKIEWVSNDKLDSLNMHNDFKILKTEIY